MYPCGLSLRNSELAHSDYISVPDPEFWIGRAKFRIENEKCQKKLLKKLFIRGKKLCIDKKKKQERAKSHEQRRESKDKASFQLSEFDLSPGHRKLYLSLRTSCYLRELQP